MQVYEFTAPQSGAIFVAEPLGGMQLATLLSRVLSRALHSPLALPLEPLLASPAADLPSLRQALLPGSATTSGGCSTHNELVNGNQTLHGNWTLHGNAILPKLPPLSQT